MEEVVGSIPISSTGLERPRMSIARLMHVRRAAFLRPSVVPGARDAACRDAERAAAGG